MKPIHVSGKRKRAIARATLTEGNGKIKINKVPLDVFQTKIARLRLKEPLVLAGDAVQKVDLNINVTGGGAAGQTEAVRLVIGKAFAKYNSKLEEIFLKYDKHLLVADVRRKEPSKPNRHGKARAKRQKSYR
ncbi:30S ribosomal protein S9 [Candidatus Woesearchaeota archaeon]|nr:30S ribosomal protein S9 [Candidatus Woesearchaeota archaeon]